MLKLAKAICSDEGQDIAEYAVMLAVILVLVVGTIRLIGSSANNVFSQAARSIQWPCPGLALRSFVRGKPMPHSHNFPFAKPYRAGLLGQMVKTPPLTASDD